MDESRNTEHTTALAPPPSIHDDEGLKEAVPRTGSNVIGTYSGVPQRSDAGFKVALLERDVEFRTLARFVEDKRRELAPNAWDNLKHIEMFARALRFVVRGIGLDAPFDLVGDAVLSPPFTPLVMRFSHIAQRRVLLETLLPLLPVAARANRNLRLAGDVAARADDGFRLKPGDVPVLAHAHTFEGAAFAANDPADWLVAGASVLIPRTALRQSTAPVAAATPETAVLCHVVAVRRERQRGVYPVTETISVDLVTIATNERVTASLDTVLSWLWMAGPDARGLDLRHVDDRALWVAFSSELRGRGLFHELEGNTGFGRDASLTPHVTERALCALVDTLALTIDPVACAIELIDVDTPGSWTALAARMLIDTGGVRETPLRTPHPQASRTRFVWADSLLTPGFAGGLLGPVAAGRAFARAMTSFFLPLGLLPCAGLRDARGDVLVQGLMPAGGEAPVTLLPPRLFFVDKTGPHLVAAAEAHHHDRALFVPEPRANNRHDLIDAHRSYQLWLNLLAELPVDDDGAQA